MKTLHLYLTRQVLATLAMTVAVFTFVLVLLNVLKEILTLLISGQAGLVTIAEAFGLLFPWVLVFALPMGMLTAALLVFGRLSADHELTAVRSSGISLLALISPVLVLSVLLCGLSAWINLDLAPRCRVAYKHLTNRMALNVAAGLVPEGRLTTISSNLSIYVESIHGNSLQKIQIRETSPGIPKEQIIVASHGELTISNQAVSVMLYDVRSLVLYDTDWKVLDFTSLLVPIGSSSTNNADQKPDLTDMTYWQLQAELHELELRPTLPIEDLTPDEQARFKTALASFTVDPELPIRVQMHRQVAFSFACLCFTLVGIPLGIRAHRRETNIGFALALALAIIYYVIGIVGLSLHNHAEYAPQLIMWLPNFIFEAAGFVMLWRANRGI